MLRESATEIPVRKNSRGASPLKVRAERHLVSLAWRDIGLLDAALNVYRMDEDRFNISVRKFLKEVGVTSQRVIEKTVRAALDARTLSAGEELDATMTLEIAAIGVKHVVTGRIEPG